MQPKDFYDENGNLIAWMWYGLSRFEKMIPINNKMRGLRLRSANIQLGNDDSLQGLFKEHRGNYYFVGEVFAVDRRLIPNSQRNYFNENDTRVLFETLLRNYFIEVLHQLYYGANKINNAYKKQENYVSIVADFEKKRKSGGFVDEEERQRLEVSVASAKKAAEDARKDLKKYEGIGDDTPLGEVRKHSAHDCDLANEWWSKFSSLPKEKQDQAKAIIALNKFEDGDYECDDPAILEVLSYYKITRDIAEAES